MISLTILSLHRSLFKTWQENSVWSWIFTNIHFVCSFAEARAYGHHVNILCLSVFLSPFLSRFLTSSNPPLNIMSNGGRKRSANLFALAVNWLSSKLPAMLRDDPNMVLCRSDLISTILFFINQTIPASKFLKKSGPGLPVYESPWLKTERWVWRVRAMQALLAMFNANQGILLHTTSCRGAPHRVMFEWWSTTGQNIPSWRYRRPHLLSPSLLLLLQSSCDLFIRFCCIITGRPWRRTSCAASMSCCILRNVLAATFEIKCHSCLYIAVRNLIVPYCVRACCLYVKRDYSPLM